MPTKSALVKNKYFLLVSKSLMEKLDVAFIASKQDPASMNIANCLKNLKDFPAKIGGEKTDLFFRENFITDLDHIDKEIDADVFVFLSMHVSKAEVHSLSVHSIGNFGKALGSGKEDHLVPAPAALMKDCFVFLKEKVEEENSDYKVIMEATHHGPVLEKPSMFIEIGSNEERYNDASAGRIVASAIIKAIENPSQLESEDVFVGVGGMHHCPNFEKVLFKKAVSYVCPKYLLENLNEELVRQAMEKSVPSSKAVLLDWKGMGNEKARLKEMFKEMKIKIKRTSDY